MPCTLPAKGYVWWQQGSHSIYGHRTLKAPHPVRSAKLSRVPSSQYCGGGPRGNPGCCSSSNSFFALFAALQACQRFFCPLSMPWRCPLVMLSAAVVFLSSSKCAWCVHSAQCAQQPPWCTTVCYLTFAMTKTCDVNPDCSDCLQSAPVCSQDLSHASRVSRLSMA